jgi:quercetin dioxygenase-like cupin family protein
MTTLSAPRTHPADTVSLPGFDTTLRISSRDSGGSVALVEHTLAPGLLGAPPHRHDREDETSYVLTGTLTVRLGDEVVTARPGDVVFKPRGQFHAFWNAGPDPVHFLEVITPGGFEAYFAELAALIPADGPPDLGALAALAARYGMTFDFASMPSLMATHGVRLGA